MQFPLTRGSSALALGAWITLAGLAAQSSETLPQGYATTEGPGYLWSGWSNAGASQKLYLPARNVFWYDNPFTGARTVRRISLRRDSTVGRRFVAFRQVVRWYLSTDGRGTTLRPATDLDAVHGTDRKIVVGTATSRATVDFKATVAGRGGPAPFDVVVPLATPFVIGATSNTIVFESRHYSSIGPAGDWYVDAHRRDVRLDRGVFAYLPGSTCVPGSRQSLVSTAWPNANLRTTFFTGRANIPVAGIIGGRFTRPFPIVGTGCTIYINPFVLVTALAGPSAVAHFDWGPIPDGVSLAGAKIWMQYGAVWPGGPIDNAAGLSRGSEITIGRGYVTPLVASAAYAYGRGVQAAGGPDRVRFADFVAPAAPILKID